MDVRIKGYLTFRSVIGDRRFELPADMKCTLHAMLDILAQEIGGEFTALLMDIRSGSIRSDIAILVNGRSIKHLPSGLETELIDGDEIAIFPPIIGGSLP